MMRRLAILGLAAPLAAIISALTYLFLFGESEPTFADATQRLASEHTVYGLSLDDHPTALVAPLDADPSEPLALVILLHATGSHVWEHASQTGLVGRVNVDRIMLLMPNGERRVGDERGWDPERPSDLARLRSLLDETANLVAIDRVYAVGAGNGGNMAQTLACAGIDGLAAAVVIDAEPSLVRFACPDSATAPVLLIERDSADATAEPEPLGQRIVSWLLSVDESS